MQGAWKVGLLVLVFFGLLVGAYEILGQRLFAVKEDVYYADFADAGGTVAGTSVLMAGVKIGSVKSVDLVDPKHARISMSIEHKYQIPLGSTAAIETALIGLSQQPVTIVPPERAAAAFMPPGSVLKGIHQSPIESVLPEAKDTIRELTKTLTATRELLSDQKLKNSIEKLIETSNKTVEQFGLIAQRTNALIDENKGMLRGAVANAAAAMEDIKKSTAIVAQFASDKRWQKDTMAILDNLNSATVRANKLVDNLNAFVTDPELRGPLKQTVANTADITTTGKRIATNTEEITKNGIVVSQKAIELADEAKDLAKTAKGVLEKLEGVFGKKVPSASSVLMGVSGNLDVMRESKPNHVRTDVNFTVPLKDQWLHFGLFDAFESNKINAELGKPLGSHGEFLYGIYASKPGIGVDYRIAPKLYLRGDLFDINHPRADIRARIEFGNGFYGWLGLNQVFKNDAPLIGLGFRK